MSTPLQRAEELKSLISQYQAELSDIYSELHIGKNIQQSQVIRSIDRIIFEKIRQNPNYVTNTKAIYWDRWTYDHIFQNNINDFCMIVKEYESDTNYRPSQISYEWGNYQGSRIYKNYATFDPTNYYGQRRQRAFFPVFIFA